MIGKIQNTNNDWVGTDQTNLTNHPTLLTKIGLPKFGKIKHKNADIILSDNGKTNLSSKAPMELPANIKSLSGSKTLIRMTRHSQSPHKIRNTAAMNRAKFAKLGVPQGPH